PRSLAWLRLPDDAPPGVYLPRLGLRGAAYTSSGQPRGALYLAPITVAKRDPGPDPSPALATFGPAIALLPPPPTPRGPDLPPCAMFREIGPGSLRLDLRWQAVADVPQNYALSLRLRDFAGSEWYALDTQPARGFYPTGMWRPGEVIPDGYDLHLPDGIPPSAGYTLTLTLYEAGTLSPVGNINLPVTLTLASPLRPDLTPRSFPAPELGLEGVDLPASVEQGQTLAVSARWLAYETPGANYLARWTLRGPTEYIVDAELAPASPPRSWPAGSFILGRARLPVPPELPPGAYAVGLQLLSGPAGNPVGAEEMVGETRVTGRAREFSPPARSAAVPIEATFGGQIKLWGYDLKRDGDRLSLTVYWGALARPQKDYKFFLHLIGPDEVPVAQVDGMPRGYSYPTSGWVAGEVVSDTLALDLSRAPPGKYRLALGWYDPEDPAARLEAVDAQGQPLGSRALLPEGIRLP
ncbi:MAG: hypothetical protein HY784_18550, partial [Chloroflexi bacterium]|nr:hypothetical protein [Chloroflexota bacterium]